MIADGSQKRLFCAIGSAARGCRGTIAQSKGYHLIQVLPLSHFRALLFHGKGIHFIGQPIRFTSLPMPFTVWVITPN
ncbi:hypothetical protein CCP4SC76_7350012 [Gammaproteobacteria bacterium]